MTLRRVLVANRGEIAVRILRACRGLGLETVLAASDADRDSLPARLADRTVCIGPGAARRSYLDPELVVAAALGTGADAVHPGYGFLAESAELSELCAAHGIVFVGPGPTQIRRMGNKLEARALARECGLPLLPGTEAVASVEEARAVVARMGLPVMIKAAAGGGGRGMKVVDDPDDLPRMLTAAAAEARAAFGNDALYLEQYIANARHVEVQVLGDRQGRILHLGERDCSLQRRHQKLVEESPAPAIGEESRRRLQDAAVDFASKLAYESAGTVEFIVDQDSGAFYFLEMNTRIQVEHPVTEMVTGIDLVQEQLRIAGGEPLRFAQPDVRFAGHAIECRIAAEDPRQAFRPDPGRIAVWNPPEGPRLRLDTHCYAGYVVPPYYDSLLAKLIVLGNDRDEAIERMRDALARFQISGVATTLPFLRAVMDAPEFASGRVTTRLVGELLRAWPAVGEAAVERAA
ncbi:MAG TPA: acetyl-CoA carboxylase biotin carboxylase subunit [Casimicrobiaceae bacterium]|nr:acetyl-CoA carboxylase biotin carboxylase subunit [Casimicrobiaceae bacterium]